MEIGATSCKHLTEIVKLVEPKALECEACIKLGGEWVHLRTCQTCGSTLCCDSSPHHHAHDHALKEHHPVIISAEPDEEWLYCYVDGLMESYSRQ